VLDEKLRGGVDRAVLHACLTYSANFPSSLSKSR
jgi:hypothetical protein